MNWQKNKVKKYKYILSGGGTGGHIFPAVAIADELRRRQPDCEILFVGASDRMEMEKVPQAGYPIKGLWISGIQRSLKPKNLLFPIKLIHSILKSRSILRQFKPDAVIGTGGYASAAVLYTAARKGIPTLIQEQNNYAGVTNKWLSKKVNKICVAFDEMGRFFPTNKLVKTGNPVRQQFLNTYTKDTQELEQIGYKENRKTVLVVGGSLGARSINQALATNISKFEKHQIQLIWQTGKPFQEEAKQYKSDWILPTTFIKNMRAAYEVADVVISRAGAIAISEICILGKASILVPLKHAAEDHQTKNARALADNEAGILVSDLEAKEQLADQTIALINNDQQRRKLERNVRKMGLPDATKDIVNQIEKLLGIQ